MKQVIILTVIALLLSAFVMPVVSQTSQNSDDVKKTALNYIEGYFYMDAERMSRALHPELAKRIVLKDENGNYFLQNMGYSSLLFATKNNKNANVNFPDKKSIDAIVVILDMTDSMASVKVSSDQYNFIDYIHLAKFENEWKIINVLWDIIPKQK